MSEKDDLRMRMRSVRRDHVASLPSATSALMFLRPPAPLVRVIPESATVGLYQARGAEAPAQRYAQWLVENGRQIALPWFASRTAAMTFRAWRDPFEASDLVIGPFGIEQPEADAAELVPDLVLVPLVAFSDEGDRIGQGGGHYDRWLASHPAIPAIGLAWDCQRIDSIPTEPHDRRLDAVITPTRLYGDLA